MTLRYSANGAGNNDAVGDDSTDPKLPHELGGFACRIRTSSHFHSGCVTHCSAELPASQPVPKFIGRVGTGLAVCRKAEPDKVFEGAKRDFQKWFCTLEPAFQTSATASY